MIMVAKERGFTLLEVLVAAAIVGTAFAIGLSAYTGITRNKTRHLLHAHAAQMAEQKLAEFALDGVGELNSQEPLRYLNVEFGYKVSFEPVRSTEAMPFNLVPMNRGLYQVKVDVFWGDKPIAPGYTLESTVLKQHPPAGGTR
jgi:prepilin-type N-terminal cleavage/methylation domain-containing protein